MRLFLERYFAIHLAVPCEDLPPAQQFDYDDLVLYPVPLAATCDPAPGGGGPATLRFYGRVVSARNIVLGVEHLTIHEGVDTIRVEVWDRNTGTDALLWSGFTDQNGCFDSGVVVVGSPLDLRIGGQASTLDLGYRLENGSLDLRTELAGAALEPLVSALRGSSPMTGTLSARVHVTVPPEPAALRGKGTIEITQGQVRGFSLMKSVLGELSALPIAAAALRGDDLSRYDEREFKRLAASFRLADGVAHIDDLVVEYRHSTVELHGTVALADGALALSGRLLLDEERQKVIPIEGVRGTVSSPRVVLDRTAVSSAFATYATGGRTREKLDEQLGPGGADLVEDLLEKFLRGSGKK